MFANTARPLAIFSRLRTFIGMTTSDTSSAASSHNTHRHEHDHGAPHPADDPSFWNDRYSEHDGSKWSGNANGALIAEANELPAGRALDIGCGEGSDAIWLAQRGWQVTGIDVSEVAIDRATQAAADAGATVEFRVGDILAETPVPERYDLITISYPALRRSGAETLISDLAAALVPAGTLLIIGHDQFDRVITDNHGIDIDQFISMDDLAERIQAVLVIETDEVRPRPDQPEDNPHSHDRILRARADAP